MRILKDFELVLSLYQGGLTQSEIAKKIGRSQHYVSIRLLAAGVRRSKKDTYAIKARPYPVDQKIVDMYASGKSSTEIAKEIGRSHGFVLRHVNEAGVVRGRGQSLRIIAKRVTPNLRVMKSGYLAFSREGKDRLFHRAVMESALGRKLGENEVVHHKNRNRLDNRIENLVLMSPSDHGKLHHARSLKCLICGNPQVARSLCKNHYQNARRSGVLASYPLSH